MDLRRSQRDGPTGWLTRGTHASFAFIPVQESSFTQPSDADHIRHGWITEVSILSPGTKPAEPRAKVTLLQPAKQPKPAKPTASTTSPPIAARPVQAATLRRTAPRLDWSQEINRRIDLVESQGLVADVEEIVANLQAELGHPSIDRTLACLARRPAA